MGFHQKAIIKEHQKTEKCIKTNKEHERRLRYNV